MGRLKEWDFRDTEANSTAQLVNRQKSALNLKIVELDKTSKTGVFSNPKNGKIKASLDECECRDFSYIGAYPRKTYTPCKHIYRLAIELGLMEAKYIGRKTEENMEKMLNDPEYLLSLEKDPSRWGSWNSRIHNARPQKNRQYRAYEIIKDNQTVDIETKTGIINDYQTTLESCSCADFEERQLPCKHIYCLAVLLGIPLSVNVEEYEKQKHEFDKDTSLSISIKISKTNLMIWSLKAWLSSLWKKLNKSK